MHKGRRRRLRQEVIYSDVALCLWCSCPLDVDHPDATLDHVRTQADGGSWSVTNLVLACLSCNRARGSKDVLRWAAICRDAGRTVHVAALIPAVTRADDPLADKDYYAISRAEMMLEFRVAAIVRKSRKRRAHEARVAKKRFRRAMHARRAAYERDACSADRIAERAVLA